MDADFFLQIHCLLQQEIATDFPSSRFLIHPEVVRPISTLAFNLNSHESSFRYFCCKFLKNTAKILSANMAAARHELCHCEGWATSQ